jgi:hypothetical protein
MLTYSLFKISDILEMDIQDSQKVDLNKISTLKALENTDARTYRDENNEVIFIAGASYKWDGTLTWWSFLSKKAGKYMTQITRESIEWIKSYDRIYKRQEMYVEEDFTAAKRWAIILGFKLEARCEAFFANGNNGLIYARINKNG